MHLRNVVCSLGLGILAVGGVLAQSNTTGTLSGQVVATDGSAVPGVLVTAESQSLQGKRTASTSSRGDYILPFLPPGDYTVAFELKGFQRVEEKVRIAVAQSVPLAVTLGVAPRAEEVTVHERPVADFTQKLPVLSSYKADMIEKLPLDRTLNSAVLLAPGARATGSGGNITISGAVSYESLYLINGVVVNDNQTGQPNPLFIEEAIQETSISTAGMSAEYGRFSGGVVNAITKSGGNEFSGSFRTTFSNDKWTSLTPFPGDQRVDSTVPTFEATLGGPIFKDKLWFFGAGRLSDPKNTGSTAFTNIPYVFENDEKRYEGKLTYSLNDRHTFKGSFTKIDLDQFNRASGNFMDLASLSDRSNPQRLLSFNYTGALKDNFFVESQFSQRNYSLVGSGSKFTDLLRGTILLDRQRGNARYHSPSSCGVCTTEQRDNYDILAKATYFLSTDSLGSHNVVFGGDVFNDRRYDDQYPSGSSFQVFGTTSIIRGTDVFPVLNSDGTTFIRWSPIFTHTQGTNFKTYSGFVNDAWRLNNRLSFNLGVRYDKNGGTDSVGNAVVKDSALSPRLAVTVDPDGKGLWTLNAGYGRYVAAILVTVADGSSPGGRAATIDFDYRGSSINLDPSAPSLVNQNDAIQTVFDWFNANGGTNRPTRGSPIIPGLTSVIQDSLGSPSAREWTAGMARKLGARGSFRIDGIYRTFGNFYSDRVDLSTGRVTNSVGQVFDLDVIENNDEVTRKYKAVSAQLAYRFADRAVIGGNYILSETYGNYDGESPGQTNASPRLYPEYAQARWNRPAGDLASDQRHKARLWLTYDVPLSLRVGSLSIGVLEFLNSGTPYGAVGPVDTRSFLPNPGYVSPPANENYYFTPRDAFRTDTTTRTDFVLNYSHKLGLGKKTELFARGTLLNSFNQQGIENAAALNQSVVTPKHNARLKRFNPSTDTPVRGINWDLGTTFGKPLNRTAYQLPRTYGFSVGIRF